MASIDWVAVQMSRSAQARRNGIVNVLQSATLQDLQHIQKIDEGALATKESNDLLAYWYRTFERDWMKFRKKYDDVMPRYVEEFKGLDALSKAKLAKEVRRTEVDTHTEEKSTQASGLSIFLDDSQDFSSSLIDDNHARQESEFLEWSMHG